MAIFRLVLNYILRKCPLTQFTNIANVKHFFTLLGKMFFTLYGKEFFTYPGKKIFTSLRLPVGTGQGASAGRIPRGKSNTWHGAGSGPTSQW